MLQNMKRAAVLILAGLVLILAVDTASQAKPPQQTKPPFKIKPAHLETYTLRACSSLGVYYAPTENGCRVTAIMPGGVVSFADGSYLDVGDIIVSVGGVSTRGTAVNLEDKIALAYANGNTEILVQDVNTGNVNSFNLP